jgi:Flp pilus assembly protein TadD
MTLVRLGQTSQAVDEFSEAARLQPANSEILNNLGCALAQLGRFAEARTQFEAALRISPSDAQVRDNLARLPPTPTAR